MSLHAVNTQIINTITPRDFGDVRAEYEAIRNAAALIDLSPAAKFEVSGKNAVPFINGLITNDVKTLKAGDGTLAAFLNVQGKVVSICRFYQTGEHLLIECDWANRETLFKNLSRFVPAGEFFLKDVTEELALLSLQGPIASELFLALTEQPVEAEPEYRNFQTKIDGINVLIASHSRAGVTGFDIFVPVAAKASVQQALLGRCAKLVGSEALEIARLEAGIPREGVDVTDSNILLEAGYEKAVSYTKGCYLGQEIIARIHWRGQPARQLRGLLVDATELPAKGTELWAADGKKVGEITSSARSFALDQIIALGYVHRYYLTAGTEFTLKRDGVEQGSATITETPFVQ
ncbi:MAG: aminomethyltransferase family protein [Acidobacteria bacterium]|nr:aminomethyltransferase family protein [Acidobacteriota bacterium]